MDVVVRPNERAGVDGSSMSTLVKWLELGRMELFRKQGISPRQLEDLGYFLVLIHVECDVIEPLAIAERFTLRTWESRLTPAKVEHSYEFRSRGGRGCGENRRGMHRSRSSRAETGRDSSAGVRRMTGCKGCVRTVVPPLTRSR
ncbi:hypothetical protein VT03_17095 [Planctomyces sp. SH-PL14]|nr:hypothetical protein VT03_17095 [Planctomyces sp. SH-PL14]